MDNLFIIIIAVYLLSIPLTEWIYKKKFREKLTYDRELEQEINYENERLGNLRVFYYISSLVMATIGAVWFGFVDIDNASKIDNLYTAFFFFYIGAIGIVSKSVLLKIPVYSRSPNQYIINSFVIVFSLYLFMDILI